MIAGAASYSFLDDEKLFIDLIITAPSDRSLAQFIRCNCKTLIL